MTKQATKIIPRSASGLRDALFDAIERVRDGSMNPEDAKEIANLSRVILDSVEVQTEFEQLVQQSEIPKHLGDMALVPPLTQALENKNGRKE